jgi:hypothetical protein
MQRGVEVNWDDVTIGKPYIFTYKDPEDGRLDGTVREKTTYRGQEAYLVDFTVIPRDEVAQIHAPKTKATAFVKKLGPVSVAKGLPHELTAQILKAATGKTPKGYPAKAFTAAREATRRSRAEVPGEEELAVGRGRRRRRRTTRRRK